MIFYYSEVCWGGYTLKASLMEKCCNPNSRCRLCASLRSRSACQNVTRATVYGNLQVKCRKPKPRRRLCASLRGRNACQDFTRATVYGNLQVKCRRPKPRRRLCASLRGRNACQDFTRATLCGNLQVKFLRPKLAHNADTLFVPAGAVETHVKISQEPLRENLQVKCRRAEWAPWSSTGLYTYRKNPCVDTLFRNPWFSCFKCNPSLAHPFLFSHPSKHQRQSAFGNKFRGPVEHKRTCATCQQWQQVSWTLSYNRQERYQSPLLSISNMCKMLRVATSSADPVLQSSRTLSAPPTPPCWAEASMCNMSTTADQPHAKTTTLPRAAYQPHAIYYYDKVIKPLYSFDATICSAMCLPGQLEVCEASSHHWPCHLASGSSGAR